MKKRFYIFLLFILISFGCFSAQRYTISKKRLTKNMIQLVVNYDPDKIVEVRIGKNRIESGVPYYLTPGEYFITYMNKTMITGSFGYNHGSHRDRFFDDEFDNEDAVHIELRKDTTVDLEGHTFQITVGVGGKI